MLEIKNVTKKFGDLVAVDDLSFDVKPGEIYGLLGANGAGKTTTFRMIVDLLTPNAGEISYYGKKIDFKVTDEIGFMIEERSLQTKMTVEEQVIHFGRLKGMKHKEAAEKLDYWLERFNIAEYKTKKIKELSKGNQQKIQFIATIINDPKLIILDEPFSGLDPFNMERFVNIMNEFKESGSIIIFSSHRIDHVEQFCEDLTVLVKGKVVLKGNIEKIKDDFMRKVIKLNGDVTKEELLTQEGVVKVNEYKHELEVHIESQDYVQKVFDFIKEKSNITKFMVEKPSLSEIFIERVGEEYDG
jgi:ABC-2 type transport system ATP-binding protein